MNTKYYLAVDIGASSGRHMLSHLELSLIHIWWWSRWLAMVQCPER